MAAALAAARVATEDARAVRPGAAGDAMAEAARGQDGGASVTDDAAGAAAEDNTVALGDPSRTTTRPGNFHGYGRSASSLTATPLINSAIASAELEAVLIEQGKRVQRRLDVERRHLETWAARQDDLLRQSSRHLERMGGQLRSARRILRRQYEQADEVISSLHSCIHEGADWQDNAVRPYGLGSNEHTARQVGALLSQGPAGSGWRHRHRRTQTPEQAVKHEAIVSVPATSVNTPSIKSESWRHKLSQFVASTKFDQLCGLVIILNAIFIGYSSQFARDHMGEPADVGIMIGEYMFLIFYTFELLLKVCAYQFDFIKGDDKWWNLFDTVLVITGTYDVIQDAIAQDHGPGGNMVWLRLLRFLKMLKMLRLVRVMLIFRELRLMLTAMTVSLPALLWALLMLGLLLYVFALSFLMGSTSYLQDTPAEQINPETKRDLQKYWNNLPSAMVTLFMAITGGSDWAPLAQPLLDVGIFYYVMFQFYVAFITFSVLNVITGLFADTAMQAAKSDSDTILKDELHREGLYLKGLKRIFAMVAETRRHQTSDGVPDGYITWKEFLALLCDGGEGEDAVMRFLYLIGIDKKDCKNVFHMCAVDAPNGHKVISLEAFVHGCVKLRGSAKSLDVMTAQADAQRHASRLAGLMDYAEERILELRGYFERLGAERSSVEPLANRLREARCPTEANARLVPQFFAIAYDHAR